MNALKSEIISCFQAYPRLSQASTEPIARAIVKIVNKTADDKDMATALNEACEHVVIEIPYVMDGITCIAYT